MNNTTAPIKSSQQNKYISLGFFRCDANAYKESLFNDPFIFIDKKSPQELNIEHKNLLCWGHSDVLTIFLFNSQDKFIDFQKICSANNKIYEDSYSLGILLQPKELEDFSIIDRLPLCGISLIKLDDKLFDGVKKDEIMKLLEESIWSEIKGITDKVKNLFPILIFSYGWEDLILIFFSDRYDLIKESVFKLRRQLKFVNLSSNLEADFFKHNAAARHATTTTYTIFATHLISSQNIEETLKNLQSKVDINDKMLVDKIYFQIRPGHLDYVLEEMKKKSNKIIDFQFIPGRYDLSVKFDRINIHGLIEFYLKDIWSFLESEENPIISTRTFFELGESKEIMEESIPCKNPIKISYLPDKERDDIKWIINHPLLPSHSAIALGNVLMSSWFLQNSFFIKGAMKSLIRFINTMKKEIKERDAHLEMATRDILSPLSLCFIDRFRGTYPLGESFAMPLINYKGSFQKQLLSIDYASFVIFNSIRECLNIQGENIDKHYFCSFIGANFSPFIIPFNVGYHKYNLATLQIPIDSFFTSKDLYYLFHEIGHMVLYALDLDDYIIEELSGLKILPSAFEEIESLLKEMLADYILFIFGFDANFNEFEKFFYGYINKIYRRTPHEARFRVSIIKTIYTYLNDRDNLTKQLEIIKRELKDSDWTSKAAAVIAVDFLLFEIADNSDYFAFFTKILNFINMTDKISYSAALNKIKQFFNSNSFNTWLEIYKDYYCDKNF